MFKKDTTAQFIRLDPVSYQSVVPYAVQVRFKKNSFGHANETMPISIGEHGEGMFWMFKGALYSSGEARQSRDSLYGFRSGNKWIEIWDTQGYNQMMQRRETVPTKIAKKVRKTWWMFDGEFFVEDEDCTVEEAQTLILAEKKKRTLKLLKAQTQLGQANFQSIHVREPLPDHVKVFVWQRDGGKCVKCGSQRNLEFDHVVPLSLGGSNTTRNIQLLCQDCNRTKGGSLV